MRRHAKEALERLEHDHEISEDDLKRSEKELQRLTDHFVAEVDQRARPQGEGTRGGLDGADRTSATGGGEDLFEDLDKFFEPIDEVGWPDEAPEAGTAGRDGRPPPTTA